MKIIEVEEEKKNDVRKVNRASGICGTHQVNQHMHRVSTRRNKERKEQK